MVNVKLFVITFLLTFFTIYGKPQDDDDDDLGGADLATIVVYFILSLTIVIISIIFINSKI
jgi:hypothetical protein